MTRDPPEGLAISRRSVLHGLTVTGGLVAAGMPGMLRAQGAIAAADPDRWWERDYRIVQTNLREIDARHDPPTIARAVRDFGGDVIVSNIGGIVAFYPTALPLQRRNPYLSGDFVAAMIEAAHAAGLAYIGRFDLSKAMQPAFDAHPDWFMRNRDGSPREFAGTYQACPNGGWAHDYGLQILSEGLTRYRPDGIFFNMTGYPQTDYANVNHGICVCDNCRREFRAMYGRDLPAREGFADPAWPDYLAFQARTGEALRQKISAHIHALVPGIPITQHDSVEQVGRGEVQRRVYRTGPEWAYQSGDQCRGALARSPSKPWSSTSTAHIDYPWRQVTEPAAYHVNRMAQQMGVGAKLDLYLMGTFVDQDDQSWIPEVSEVFRWRQANSAAFAGMTQSARVAIYQSGATGRLAGMTPHARYQADELRGLYSALVDSRIPFQYVSGARIADGTVSANALFDVIILPNAMMLSEAEAAALDRFVEQGGLLIATGNPGAFDDAGRSLAEAALQSLPVARYAAPAAIAGWTLDPATSVLKPTGRVPLDGTYFGGTLRGDAEVLMRFAPDQRYGPPEFSYAIPGDEPRAEFGIAMRAHGTGRAIHIPWPIGWHYYRDNLPAHREILEQLITGNAPAQPFVLAGDGPVELIVMHRPDGAALPGIIDQRQQRGAIRPVELIVMHRPDGAALLTLVNYAGQRHTRYAPPPRLHGLRIGMAGPVPRGIRALVGGGAVTARGGPDAAGRTWLDVPPIGAFEVIALPPAG